VSTGRLVLEEYSTVRSPPSGSEDLSIVLTFRRLTQISFEIVGGDLDED